MHIGFCKNIRYPLASWWFSGKESPASTGESESESLSVMSDSLWPQGLYSPWNSPGQKTGVGSCSLLHRIFPTQESNQGLLHCRHILYQLSHKGSPRILQWITQPFCRGSSWPRSPPGVSFIADRFFTSWATREARIQSLGQEDPLGKEMTTYSSILAWEVLWTEGAWWATVYGVPETVRHDLVIKQQQALPGSCVDSTELMNEEYFIGCLER